MNFKYFLYLIILFQLINIYPMAYTITYNILIHLHIILDLLHTLTANCKFLSK